ncbi:transporter substrate-binding domain-containing protein [uncultured Bartonella sp.]|uniref:transporter substrate-binding domain-containing protein n=1 Tax=uncultured Bartonella sp. TaxID=104108 RepID=UPI00260DAF0E|nr:transporter substrate-binding domain-containing protein [uncultured Bartonella sp.]
MMMKKILAAIFLSYSLTTVVAADASKLDDVLETKTLRVCTTGDYKPYSFLKTNGSYEGIDIAMAQSLGRSLDAKVEFVPTSWKNLLDDFLNDNCDIAMGGISISLARQQKVYMSYPVDVDGKIPFVRCQDKNKYTTIETLNHKNVRAIEPAGGTNEAFVRKYMPAAKLELFHDNTKIFQNIVDKKADVMITDASEALYQKRNYPTLCAVNPTKPLEFLEKGYMLPKGDMTWKLYVDQWLHLVRKNGEYNAISAHWLKK